MTTAASRGLERTKAELLSPRDGSSSNRPLACRRLVALKKQAEHNGQGLVFADESGRMLQSLVRRTWAPQGQTPVYAAWTHHYRLSVISSLSVSPKRRCLGLHFDILDHTITTDDFETFITRLPRRLNRSIMLIMDRCSVE